MIRVVILTLALAMPAAAQPDPVQTLAWIADADYRADFQRQVAQGSFEFRGVSGFGYLVPGISWEELSMCFSGIADSRNIEGTSDAIESDEHARLNGLARTYALRLNHLVRAHLTATGRSHCEPGEDWGALGVQIFKYLGRFPEAGYGGPSQTPQGPVLGLFVPVNNPAVISELCALIARHDVQRSIVLALSHGSNLREGLSTGKFTRVQCEAGRIAG